MPLRNSSQDIDNEIPVITDEEREELFSTQIPTTKDQVDGIPLISPDELNTLGIVEQDPIQEEILQLERLQKLRKIREDVMEEQKELESTGRAILDSFFGAGELMVQGIRGTVGLAEGVISGTTAAILNTFDPIKSNIPDTVGRSNAEIFTQALEQSAEDHKFEPKTKFAQGVDKAILEYVIEPLDTAAKFVGEEGFEATGSPTIGATGETAVKAVPIVAGFYLPTPKIFTKKPKDSPVEEPDEVPPRSLEEKEIQDEVNFPEELPDVDPIKTDDGRLVAALEDNARKKFEINEKLNKTTDPDDKVFLTTLLSSLDDQAKIISSQLSKNKADELSSIVGTNLRKDPDVEDPEFQIVGPDKKTSVDLKKDIFEVTPKLHSNGTVEPVFKKKFKDISVRQAQIGGNLKPGKFMSETHPIVKWGVDKVTEHSARIRDSINFILKRPTFKQGAGVTVLRKTKQEATEAGALTIFNALAVDRQDLVRSTALKFDKERIEPLRSDLEAEGLSSKEITAYNALRAGVNLAVEHVNRSIKKYGPEGASTIEKIPGYLPHVWFGDFRVFVRDKKNNLVNVLPANTRLGASALSKKYQKANPDFKLEIAKAQRGSSDESIQIFSEAISFLEKRGDPDTAAQVRKIFEENLDTAGFGITKTTRKDVGGFAGDVVSGLPSRKGRRVNEFRDGYIAYVEGAMKYAENLRMKKEMNNIYLDPHMRQAYPNALNYLKMYQDNAIGVRGKTSEWLDKTFGDWLGSNGLGNVFQGINKVGAIVKLFTFNTKFLALQGLQPYHMISGALLNSKAYGFRGSAMRSIVEGHKEFFNPSPDTIDAIKFSTKQGTIEPKFINETMGANFFNRGIFTSGQKAFEILSGRAVAARMEMWARTLENTILYRHMRNSGVNHKEAREKAAYLTDKHMTEYHHRERALIFNEGSFLGPFGRPLGLFKNYQVNWLSQLGSFIRTAKKKKDLKPLAAFLGSQAFVGGAIGFIGVKEADAILELLGMTTVTDSLLKSGAPEAVVYGPLSAGLDFDLTASTQAPSILPKEIITVPGLEYASKLLASTWNWGTKFANGFLTEIDTMEFQKALLPTSFHGFIEKAYTKDGESPVPDPNRRGRGKLRRDFSDWRARFLSGRSLKERRTLDALWQLTRMNKKQALTRDTIITSAAYFLNNNQDIPDWLLDRAFDPEGAGFLNGREFSNAVITRTRQMNESVIERLTKYGRTKKGREQLQRLEDYGVSVFD